MNKDVLFKGNLKEGIYKLIKTTNGWVLEGEDIAYAGFYITDRASGEWIDDIFGFQRCSHCRSIWHTSITENIFTNYCPRCGARMKGADNE